MFKEVATTGKSITIEKYGKPYITLMVATLEANLKGSCNKIDNKVATKQEKPCQDAQGSTKVATLIPEVDPVLAAIQEAKQKKAEVIQALKDKTEEITKEVTEKHYCIQCAKLGKRVEALRQYEVTTDTGERPAWLCGRCAGRALVYA